MSWSLLAWAGSAVLAGMFVSGVVEAAGPWATPARTVAVALALPAAFWLALRPDWLPPVLAVTAFVESFTFGGLTLSRIVAPFAVLVIVLRVGHEGIGEWSRSRVGLAVGAYATWALASAMWTLDPEGVLGGDTGRALGSLAISGIYLLACVVFVRTPEHVKRLAVTVWGVATVAGAGAILAYLQGGGRASGYDGDPNFFAALQVFAVPFGVVLAAHARTPLRRTAALGGVGIIVASVITSLSRGGILALVAVLLLLLIEPARMVFRSRARKTAAVAVTLVGVMALLSVAYSDLSARSETLFTTSEGGSGRTNLWRAAYSGFEERPVIGLGFGAFKARSNELLRATPGVSFEAYRLRIGGQYAHNAYIGTLAELGLIGLGLLLLAGVTAARAFRQSARRAAERGDAALAGFARALFVSLVGFAAASLFLSTETDRALWLMLGLAIALPNVVARPDPGGSPNHE